MPDFKVIRVSQTPYLYVTKTSSMAPEDTSSKMGEAFREVWSFTQGPVSGDMTPAGEVLYFQHKGSYASLRTD